MAPHRIPGLLAKVNSEGFFTISQVAKRVGRSADTIRHWQDTGRIRRPTKKMPLGEGDQFVWLYDEKYIADCQAIAATIRTGRPTKEEAKAKKKIANRYKKGRSRRG